MNYEIDWNKYLLKYSESNVMKFETWLFDLFKKEYGDADIVIIKKEDILLADLWKNGSRNRKNVLKINESEIDNLNLNSNECLLIEALIKLPGIGIPTASAILTLLRPEKYTVIDSYLVRVINNLEKLDLKITEKPECYSRYLKVINQYKNKTEAIRHWPLRNIDKAFWAYGEELESKKKKT